MHIVAETALFVLQVIVIFVKTILRWFIPPKYKDVKGEICLITGAGNGLGRLMALEFAKLGAVVILWDINESDNNETLGMIHELGGTGFAQKCDVSKREDVYKAAKRAREVACGDISILVNNAGIVYGKEFLEIADEEIEKTLKVNTLAHFWTVRAFLPNMLKNNHGHIVTIGSTLGLFPSPGMPDYVASKYAAVGFHNSIELDLRKYNKDGVKTTLVCPYHVTTGLFTGVECRFPNAIPSLKPTECVSAIMHGVLSEQPMIAIPRTMYLAYNMHTWLPHEAILLHHKFLGTFDAMKKFIPNRSYQKDAVNKSSVVE